MSIRLGNTSTRPDFYLPFPAGSKVTIKTYNGHGPSLDLTQKKMDMYAEGWPEVVACAAGVVHEHFDPGGLEIRHGDTGWFTTYMHMTNRAPVGTRVARGERIGTPGTVGTGAKHLHNEQLYAWPGATDATTYQMTNPWFHELSFLDYIVEAVDKPIYVVSENKRGTTVPPLHPSGTSPHHKKPWPNWMPKGHVLGPITGPDSWHGGVNAQERGAVKALQEQGVWLGAVPGVRYGTAEAREWCDGVWERATTDMVLNLRAKLKVKPLYRPYVGKPMWTKVMSF